MKRQILGLYVILASVFLASGMAGCVGNLQDTQTEHAADDRAVIQELIAQYAYRWDAKETNAFADLFTDDVVVERYVQDELKSRLNGRDQLSEYARLSHLGRLADRQTRHHMSGITFRELSPDRAVTRNMVLITHQTVESGTPFVAGAGVYEMTWQKVEDGWKIAKRILYSDAVTSAQ